MSAMCVCVCVCVCLCVGFAGSRSRLPAAQVTGQTGHVSENTLCALCLLLEQNAEHMSQKALFTAEALSDTQTQGL